MKQNITICVDEDVLLDFDDLIHIQSSKRSTLINDLMKKEVLRQGFKFELIPEAINE